MNKVLAAILLVGLSLILAPSCQKELSYETGTAGSTSLGAFVKDSGGNCSSAVVKGTYAAGTSLDSSNYVNIQVNVTQSGAYKISSDAQNGFSFADSGYFTTTGTVTVKLKASGTPVLATTTSFTVTYGSSTCAFAVTVGAAGSGGTGGSSSGPERSDTAWHFTDSVTTHHDSIDSAFLYSDSAGRTHLEAYGFTTVGDTVFIVDIVMPSSTPAVGTYSTATSAAFGYEDYTNSSSPFFIYLASPTTATANPATSMSISITSWNASTRYVTGTFSGTAQRKDGKLAKITGGGFIAKVAQ